MTEAPARPDPPMSGTERAQLNGFLDFLRSTIVLKATGLTDEQARVQHLPSRLTTVAGLVGHLTYVESYWFGVVLAGRADPWAERLAEDPDAEFIAAMSTPITDLIAAYEKQCADSREIAAGLELSSEVGHARSGNRLSGNRLSVRWVLLHMIEETGRHAGHLDLLRELIDGSVGE
jgi:uncharacterized damage-inducible protein DinB